MKKKYKYLLLFLLVASIGLFAFTDNKTNNSFVSFIVNPKKQAITFYYKDDKQVRYGSILKLREAIIKKHGKLLFAMNGGMYKQDHSPQGLYIENSKTLYPTDTIVNANGNFYLQPNGVFYIDVKGNAGISTSITFKNNSAIKYATQSGPMLLINGAIHHAFKQGSSNLQIRNGVGILPDNTIVFAMSKEPINFYDFAQYFKSIGCKNALYLDGFVSRTYLPEQNWIQTDGDFGVIIGVIE